MYPINWFSDLADDDVRFIVSGRWPTAETDYPDLPDEDWRRVVRLRRSFLDATGQHLDDAHEPPPSGAG